MHCTLITFYTNLQLFQLTLSDVIQPYKTKPKGGLGIHCNLHISLDESNKFLFLCVKPVRGVNLFVLTIILP